MQLLPDKRYLLSLLHFRATPSNFRVKIRNLWITRTHVRPICWARAWPLLRICWRVIDLRLRQSTLRLVTRKIWIRPRFFHRFTELTRTIWRKKGSHLTIMGGDKAMWDQARSITWRRQVINLTWATRLYISMKTSNYLGSTGSVIIFPRQKPQQVHTNPYIKSIRLEYNKQQVTSTFSEYAYI